MLEFFNFFKNMFKSVVFFKMIMFDFLGVLFDVGVLFKVGVLFDVGVLFKIKGVGEFFKFFKVEMKLYFFNLFLIFNKGFLLGKV